MRAVRFQTLTLLLCVSSSIVYSQNEEETWSLSLDTITVKGQRYSSAVKTNASGAFLWSLKDINYLPQILGNADPMHYAQMLPGIQVNNEYRSGINIQGGENSHNFISVSGVPLYNVNHLLGFFSAFNVSHYGTMYLDKTMAYANSANRLGGELTMDLPKEKFDTLSGELSLGLISSQGTLRIPLGKKLSVALSLRGSYINLLYGSWLKADNNQLKYSFYDSNLTFTYKANDNHTFLFDCYSGNDRLRMLDDNYMADMSDKWGNYMGALHWLYDNHRDTKAHTTLYATSYHNEFGMKMQSMDIKLPSGITDLALKSKVDFRNWNYGIELIWHHVQPQSMKTSGTFNTRSGSIPSEDDVEASAFVQYSHRLIDSLYAIGGIKGSVFRAKDATFYAIDPSVCLLYDQHSWQLRASYSLKHQYLFQTGFTSVGLPTEFWISCSKNRPPQYAHEFAISGSTYLFGRRFRLVADAYYKKLYHQIEYRGSVLDYLNTVYDLERNLLHGSGDNYGFSIMFNKCSGPLTGWISYAYSHAWRSFEQRGMVGTYPANHDRPHELDVVLAYTLNRHWSFGATFAYATGTPFTTPTHIAFVNGNLLIRYGEYNANRLSPYMRLNLSVNYKWHTNLAREQGVNFSLYNATARGNDLFYFVDYHENGGFWYKPLHFLVKILPSISYFCKF